MNPVLAILIQTIGPMAIDQVIRIYDAIASDPGTPDEVAAQAAGLVVAIKALNVQIAAAPLPGDEP